MDGTTHPTRNIAALIGSRICHDLISPVGAVSNGLELLQLAGVPDGPEMQMLTASAGNASARLRFFRVAFGAGGDDQMVGGDEAAAILAGVFCEKVGTEWPLTGPVRRRVLQAIYLGVLCVEGAVPYGGRITVAGSPEAVEITATGARMAAPGPHWAALISGRRPDADLAPADVQFALLPDLLADLGRRAGGTWSDAEVVLRF